MPGGTEMLPLIVGKPDAPAPLPEAPAEVVEEDATEPEEEFEPVVPDAEIVVLDEEADTPSAKRPVAPD